MRNTITVIYILICITFFSCATAQISNHAVVKTDTIADKMLIYQLSNGAWPKQLKGGYVVKYEMPLTDDLMAKIKATNYMHATIDNAATSREINTLVAAYKVTNNKKYLEAAEKGIDYLLKAQYANGGWPQYYPDSSSYRAEVTYNDNAIANVLNIMLNIATQAKGFEVVNKAYIPKAKDAVERGLDCILKTQIKQNGKLSIWAAQYDHRTLQPAKARSFEPASLSTLESVGVVRFLMRLKNPSQAVKTAITNAIDWFERTKIVGYRYEKLPNIRDKGLVKDENSIIWARFYDFDTNKPIFGDRDNSIKGSVAEISAERRFGYAWYGDFAAKLLASEYPKWKKANP